MLRQVALWLLQYIEERLDPELKQRLETYRKNRAQLEAQTQEELQAVRVLETRLEETRTQRAYLQDNIAEYERELTRLDSELRRIKDEDSTRRAALRSASDSDILRHDL